MMHPVIEYILKRKNKKVPVRDGRKIALVLFGGSMTAIRGAGALLALQDMGLVYAFDEIYSVSAGFANICYFFSGNGKEGTSIYYDDLIGRKFLKYYKPWNITDISYLITVMKDRKPLNVDNIMNTRSKIFIRLRNVKTKRPEYLEIHDYPAASYHDLLHAAMSIPYLQPGSIKIGSNYYKDGDFFLREPREHLEHVLAGDATDILVVYNRPEQRMLNLGNSDRIFEIIPDSSLRRFERDPARLRAACREMGAKVKVVFGLNEPIDLEHEKYVKIGK